MRIAELSERAGVAEATIKYYVREGLLPAGERTSYNRVGYGDFHLRRLRLIGVLLRTGGFSVTRAREVLAAVDEEPLHSALGAIQKSMPVASTSEVLEGCAVLGHGDLADLLGDYRQAAESLAELELAWLARAGADRDVLAERALVGTLLGDALLAAARREAQARASARMFRD